MNLFSSKYSLLDTCGPTETEEISLVSFPKSFPSAVRYSETGAFEESCSQLIIMGFIVRKHRKVYLSTVKLYNEMHAFSL